MPDTPLILKDEVFAINGAVFEVYREKGCGFLEAVYQECLAKEFAIQGIPFVAQPELRLSYKGQPIEAHYKPDFVCFGSVIVELKALSATTPEHEAQVLNYLKATGHRVGLLVNFGCHPKAISTRFVL